ncbi:MAG TPA: PAS domain-containing protein [Gemmatimonadaceae bacterium]|nr:PAS domain-containing protein [Gemmatimonadaceae bacterium]
MNTSETKSSPCVAALTCNPMINALLEQVPAGILVVGRDGEVEYVNALACTLLDERRRARHTIDVWRASLAQESSELDPINWIIARALLTGEIVREEEVEYLDAHDEWRTLSVSATPIRDRNGDVELVVISFADVTFHNRARDWEPVMRGLSRL